MGLAPIVRENPPRRQPRTQRAAVARYWGRAEKFAADNLEAARIITATPQKYGGEGSGLVLWATAVLRRERERQAA